MELPLWHLASMFARNRLIVDLDGVHSELPITAFRQRDVAQWFHIAARVRAAEGDFSADLMCRISEPLAIPTSQGFPLRTFE